MRIVIVGAGVVGTATGKGFARRGHAVHFVDTDPARVELLRAEGLAASATIELSGPPAAVLLSVPTPAGAGGYDLTALRAAAGSVGDALRSADELPMVVLRSTVAPGTLEQCVQPILETRSGLQAGDGFSLASNPEFLRAECALEDFLHPWMTVVGARSKRTREQLAELYQPFGGSFRAFADPAEAELVKLAHNVFNATKISFFNELWLVASELGLDAGQIATTIARSAEASWNPDYGTRGGRPYSGACLPKDVAGFIGFAAGLGLPVPMAHATAAVNDHLAAVLDEAVIDLRDRDAASAGARQRPPTPGLPAVGPPRR